MTTFEIVVAALAAITLFVHGLQGVSREFEKLGDERLGAVFGRFGNRPWLAFAVGAATTAVVQSSSAVSSLACALVNGRVLSFRGALGIVLGANVGTTATAWLVAFNLTGIGPYLLIAGTVVGLIPTRIRYLGKPLFFFGLIFFALGLISANLQPILAQPWARDALVAARVPIYGVLVGLGLTAVVQSSSAVVGLTVVLVNQRALPPEAAIYVVVGANLGSTTTALLGSIGMDRVAKATAVGNALFNAGGLLLFLPFLGPFARIVANSVEQPQMAVATAHLLFNLVTGAAFMLLLGPTERWLRGRFEVPSGR